ncbi:hypothetical protein CKQ90_35380, partial [Klebsiella pneumoniae]
YRQVLTHGFTVDGQGRKMSKSIGNTVSPQDVMISTAMKGKAPYRQVLTHGFTVDGQGRKMSKSIGNTVSPQDVM